MSILIYQGFVFGSVCSPLMVTMGHQCYSAAQSTGAIEYNGRISKEGIRPLQPTSALDMILKNLMAKL